MDIESQIHTLLPLLQNNPEALGRIIEKSAKLQVGQAKEKVNPDALYDAVVDVAMSLKELTGGKYDWTSVIGSIANRLSGHADALAVVDPNNPEVSRLRSSAVLLEMAQESTEISILGRFEVEEPEG
jgi:hypothetical protein